MAKPKLRGTYREQDGSIVTVELELDTPVSIPDLFNLNRRRKERRERASIRAIERRIADRRKKVQGT